MNVVRHTLYLLIFPLLLTGLICGCGIDLNLKNSSIGNLEPDNPDNPLPQVAVGLYKVSEGYDGQPSNGDSGGESLSISDDGRYIVFESTATNLVPGDNNGFRDVFLHDLLENITFLVSVDSNGNQGNGDSTVLDISGDGKVILFSSIADNLVPGDTNGVIDLFTHNRITGVTTMVSRASDGSLGNGSSIRGKLNQDGRYLAFETNATNFFSGDTNGRSDILKKDLETGVVILVSRHTNGTLGNNHSYSSRISNNGRWVSFWSRSTNLSDGDTNSKDAFFHDTNSGETFEASIDSDGSQSISGSAYTPDITDDGLFTAFHGSIRFASISDTNGEEDIYLRNHLTGVVTRASESQSGVQSDGRSHGSCFSGDGIYLAFNTRSTNLIDGETMPGVFHQVVVKNLQTGEVTCISCSQTGAFANDDSGRAYISGDGNSVVFKSDATNLVEDDTNNFQDVFVRKLR